jgi:alpha-N-acetylglucosamine transferase
MNENIIKLKQAAGIDDNPDQEGLDLFAQLIIQECAELAYSYNIFGRGRPWNLIIKEYFGLAVADTDVPPYLRDTK